ncbi:uncharacterized protein BYT42DRAFT_607934 [Radiomyces spectabilis]|uniref:uncharacterized protein n=1 Tax=Radiomyces spectabilis TaxID=64574 RepID=UPI00222036AF|nr:uncharacterized protein BYT42DRAFT_607934 [Radiomyces spectabilis]KAI8369560.1 hypothetical protein BYT42DRAFT_607934 [Radiomyces spectabilis]
MQSNNRHQDILPQQPFSFRRRSLNFIFSPLNQRLPPTTSSTNNIILDYLLHLSIQSRLSKLSEKDRHTRWSDLTKAEQAVESIVAGILCNKTPGLKFDARFEQRLHLCQLTNIVFGDGKRLLTEAIPFFLKTSAMTLRVALDNAEDAKPMIFAGQRVMGGGMPPRWYDLFLELLTQAAIQSVRRHAGLASISEIFSYGDVEDEDEPENLDDEEEEDEEDEDAEEDDDDIWGIKAADHHLLFPKTRTMFLFKTQLREREKQFLNLDQDSLMENLDQLAHQYPLDTFEAGMCEFIQLIVNCMDTPTLYKCDKLDAASFSLPTICRFPEDGSLLMPEMSDIEDEDNLTYRIKRTSSAAGLDDKETIKRPHA